jgi:PTS system nitrogen regulatory IIA component
MDLENFFTKKQIILLKNTEKQLVIKEMLMELVQLKLIDNPERYYAQVIHRESLENTGIGKGVAIPHARTDSVSSFVTILGISEEGIDYHSYDNVPVQYLLLSIFPTEMSTKYLYLVGMIARIFSDTKKKESIDKAKTPTQIYNALQKESKAYFASISEKSTFTPNETEVLSGIPSSSLDLLIRLDRLYDLFDEGDTSESIAKKIDDLKKLIDNKSLTYYERMRKKCQNPFAIVEKNTCTGCHMEIPPIYYNQNKERNSISICTHCGRFLIFL